jgi:hypothetical protein
MPHRAEKDTKDFNKGQFLGDAPPRESQVPNPGSEEAIALGCNCPVLDNNHGKGSDFGDGIFWINQTCVVHGGVTDRPIGKRLIK